MSSKAVGWVLIAYTLFHVGWLVISKLNWLAHPLYHVIGELVHVLLLVVLFAVVWKAYTRKEKIVQLKHELYYSLYESDHNLIFLLDKKGFFVRMNTTVAKELGLRPERVIGRHYTDYIQEEIREKVAESFQTALRGEVAASDIAFAMKPGESFYGQARYSPIVLKGKVESVLVALKDTTEKTNVKKALQETQRHLKLINEHASEMIAILDEQGKMIFTTPSFTSVFGKNPGDYYGKSPLEALDQPGIAQDGHEHYVQSLKRNEKLYYPFVREVEKGVFLYFESVCTPIVEENGEVKQMVCVVRDVTERKDQEIYLYRTERLHMLGEMAAGIAHEIKNPLTSIRGFVELFASKNIEEKYEPYYQLVLDELERVNKITHELLTFSKPKEQKKSIIIIEQVIDDIRMLLNIEAASRGILIHQSFPEERTFVNGDEVQLKQVFLNVLKNAIEASKTGNQITIETMREEKWYVIRVIDEGCGIEEERMNLIGEAFHTSKEEGTGLGLMVSKSIIKEHGGTIQIKSVLDKGTIVDIRLPYVEKEIGEN